MKTALFVAALLFWRFAIPTHADWKDAPIVLSDERMFVVVKSNTSPYQVIASLAGKVDLLIQASEPIPRKLGQLESVAVEQEHLLYEKTGKTEIVQYLCSVSGKGFRVHLSAVTPLHVPEAPAAVPKVPAARTDI